MFGLVGNEANSIAPQNECWALWRQLS
jgi:hypothetical protein